MTNNAVAYLRTSSAANVGADKDSDKRQLEACNSYARGVGLKIAQTFYDAGVSGADAVTTRPGFAELLAYCEAEGVRTIIFENASRLSRDLIAMEVAYQQLSGQGYILIAADSPSSFVEDTPTSVMVRQILGAVSEFEKSQLVAKLRAARDRKRAAAGKCEGRKNLKELNPELVRQCKRLARKNPKTGKKLSLGDVSRELKELGYVNSKGRPFASIQVSRMLAL